MDILTPKLESESVWEFGEGYVNGGWGVGVK